MSACVVVAAFLLAAPESNAMSEYQKTTAEAERLYENGSFQSAHDLYENADRKDLPKDAVRWIEFRLADTEWRSQAATKTHDNSRYEASRQKLDALVRDAQRVEDRDRVWAEVQESLGDFWWTRREQRNWYQAWQHYQLALDWWGGAADVELARKKYLAIVWRAVRPADAEEYYYYGYYGNWIPVPILENVLQIAQTKDDLAHAHYLMAMGLKQQGDWEGQARIPEEFEKALASGKTSEWYDDALYGYAEFLEQNGRAVETEGGGWTREVDYVEALELYRRFLREFKKGETRFWDQAKQRADQIVRAELSVSVSNLFLPDSEIQYYLSWRNVASIDLALYQVDLVDAVELSKDDSSGSWLQSIKVDDKMRRKAWKHDPLDKGDHKPGSAQLRLDEKLEPGAYVLEASSGKNKARELVLVTDTAIVLKAAGSKVVAFAVEVEKGAPLAEAQIVLWQKHYTGSWKWQRASARTNAEGVAVFDRIKNDSSSAELFAISTSGKRQSYSAGYAPSPRGASASWKLYAYTDRPAYRPGDTAQWKVIARRYDGSVYKTPSGEKLSWEIVDPRGSKVKEGEAKLNAFGSAWGEIALKTDMPLGEYRVRFKAAGSHIGEATLLRLEEYKLPEFQVTVKTPEDASGKRKAFRLGDKVEASVEVEYYFGGAVANADVELQVFQSSYYPTWQPPRDYPWFYEDMEFHRGGYGYGGSVIKSERIKTDAEGKATVTFDTPRNAGQDYDYQIVAKVTDSSRREVVGSGSVRVTRQPFYVYANAQHSLYKPQDKISVDFRAFDANQEPVSVEGKVTVYRDFWREVWVAPDGKEASGAALELAMRTEKDFHATWRVKFRGYEHDEVLTRNVKTDAEGKAEMSFTPAKEGYYRVAWVSKVNGPTSETTVWVATNASSDIGYRHGGLEILLDKDTVRPGAVTPILVTVPTPDRWVLFTVEADDLYEVKVLHVTGTVKLVELAVDDKHVPNVYLGGLMVSERQIFAAQKQVVVPPVKHFLEVSVEPDKKEYQAREEGSWRVTTRDGQGKPVAAEVSLGVVDESVYYIQQDLAADPRQFFFGDKRGRNVQTHSTFQQRSFIKLVPGGAGGVLLDDRLLEQAENQRRGGAKQNEMLGKLSRQERDGDDESAMSESAAAPAGVAFGSGGRMRASKDSKEESKKSISADAPPPPGEPPSGGEGSGGPAVTVRADFRATAFWGPDVATGPDGTVSVKLKYPDSLTAWRATARAAGAGAQFGSSTGKARTRMPLLVRLQGPRFFVVGDTTVISAVVNNNTSAAISSTPELLADGLTLKGPASKKITVPANGSARVDWTVEVNRAGEARLRVTAKGGGFGDAMEKTFPVFEHGVEKLLVKAGKMKGTSADVKLTLPKERRAGSTALTLQVAPSLAVTMLDSLPYLIDYPYGCTEQTMSRFLPAAIVARTLKDLGVDPADAMERAFGGIEKAHTAKTQPNGKKDLAKLDETVEQGLTRLYDFQHGDGGWGWWKEGDSDRYMTAYVLWGMSVARDGGITVKSGVPARAAAWLEKELVQEENDPDRAAWLLHALSAHHAKRKTPGNFEKKAFERAFKDHTKLSAYGRALLAISAKRYGYADEAKLLVTNLQNGVVKDTQPDTSIVLSGEQESGEHVQGTVHWGSDAVYWRWSESGIESTAFAIAAMMAVDPASPLLDPAVNWLVKNRRGAQWSNTKDTAIVVLALTDYLKKSGEVGADLEYRVTVNGKEIAKKKIAKADAVAAPSRFTVDPKLVKDGVNQIRIERTVGKGPLYFSAEASFFSLEEPVTAAGNEIFVRRQYFKYVGRKTLLKGYVYDREPLLDGEKVKSGERIEVVVSVEAKNDYEYLVFEDLKPAGFEAVQVKSGQPVYAKQLKSSALEATLGSGGRGLATDEVDYTGQQRWVYQELRDRKVALFLDRMPQGVWEIRYDLRAEVPGKFHALPVLGHAMYVPEIRCNGAEIRVEVLDRD